MKRIIVWVDCEDKDLEETLRKVEKCLKSTRSWYKIVSIDEVIWSNKDK
jgi:hypothetical protein